MVAQFAQFVSQVLPLTVGDGRPVYRVPFMNSSNPSQELSKLANTTQHTYHVNPYISDPSHAFDARG